MPDSVRCTMDSANTFTCEVDIGPDPTPNAATSGASTQPAPAPPPEQPIDPVVAALISSYRLNVVGRDVIEPVKPPLGTMITQVGKSCLSSGVGLLLLAGAKPGILGVLAGVKTGFDVSKCIATESYSLVHEATQKAANDDCTASGGVVTFVRGDTVMCNVTGAKR